MNIQIKNRWTGSVLFKCEADSLKLAVELAIKQKINLSGSNLSYSDLSGSNLRGSNLRGSNLSYSDLSGSDLSGSDLSGSNLSYSSLIGSNLSYSRLIGSNLSYSSLSYSNLSGSDLSGSDLSGSNLSYSNLSGSDLRGSNLSYSRLSGSDLSGSNLSYSNLSGSKGVNKYLSTPLLLLLDQPGPIRAYKLVTKEGYGPFNGGLLYEVGSAVSVDKANTDDAEQCAAGINLATLDWCLKEWQQGQRILLAEFTAQDIAAIPISTDGKFRVHRCKIVAELDLDKDGMPKDE